MSAVQLVTGFPGFIGRRLVARLLDAQPGERVACLVEPRMLPAARALAAPLGDRVELLAGDITDRRLGLDDATYARLARDVRTVFHLAAVYDLAVPLEVAQRVNVDGTGNVLDLCLACERLERLAYVSTAYVAGDRTGVVYEHELVVGQGFKNHYESTKFQAEVWVRSEQHRVPTTILRPAIVVGDSRTGETEKFDGPYYILRALSRAQRLGRPLPQFGSGTAAFNVVPVDYVVEAMIAAAGDEATLGQTLHLVDPDPLSARELIATLARAYGAPPPRGRLPAAVLDASLRIGRVRGLLEDTPRESAVYLNHPVKYDARRTVDLLRPHGLVPPRFPDYADAVVGFFKAHEDDPAYRPGGR